MPQDNFADQTVVLDSPAIGLSAITPDDTTDLPQTSRAINVAGSGAIRVTAADGTEGTIAVAAGTVFPIRAARIWATGTTATGIVALY